MARQAKSLDVLLAEVNKEAPKRDKASDGGLGDPAHASRASDHNPNSAGVWRARDVTNDPSGGMPGPVLARLVASKLGKHPALMSGAYVIFDRRIISTSRLGESWRPYDGTNAHEHHVHVSVSTAAAGYDSTKAWNLFTNQEDDDMLTPAQEKLLILAAADSAAAKDLARRALARGQINTRAILAASSDSDEDFAQVRKDIAKLEAEEAGS